MAQVANHVVFADPNNQDAKNLVADALEQLGYQAESGPWRNFYLTGAKELRDGVAKLPTPNTASPDTVRAMSLDLFFDYLGVRLNREKRAIPKSRSTLTLLIRMGNIGILAVPIKNIWLNSRTAYSTTLLASNRTARTLPSRFHATA